jgi:hypothetical protein
VSPILSVSSKLLSVLLLESSWLRITLQCTTNSLLR